MLGNVVYNLEFFQLQTDCAILIGGSALIILVEPDMDKWKTLYSSLLKLHYRYVKIYKDIYILLIRDLSAVGIMDF